MASKLTVVLALVVLAFAACEGKSVQVNGGRGTPVGSCTYNGQQLQDDLNCGIYYVCQYNADTFSYDTVALFCPVGDCFSLAVGQCIVDHTICGCIY